MYSTALLASMPIPPSRTSPRNKNPNHIPRPRNAFMLFRSAFAAAQKVSTKIEHDNRHITRIIANCWNRLPDAEKLVWRDRAAAEKALHGELYPNYRFSPVGRDKKPKKRQVRRNTEKDVKRCAKVADLVMAGTCGSELERVMTEIDKEHGDTERVELDVFSASTALFFLDSPPETRDTDDIPPFRSPLLPPQQLMNDSLVPLSLVSHVDPVIGDAIAPHDELALFNPYQYYQPTDPASHFAFVQGHQGNLVEPELSAPDYSIFTWSQSNNYPYYH